MATPTKQEVKQWVDLYVRKQGEQSGLDGLDDILDVLIEVAWSGTPGPGPDLDKCVQVDRAQAFTDAEKEQGRDNLGITEVDTSKCVKVDRIQGFSNAEKVQGINNLGPQQIQDAIKELVAILKNKTINADDNTIENLTGENVKSGYLVGDITASDKYFGWERTGYPAIYTKTTADAPSVDIYGITGGKMTMVGTARISAGNLVRDTVVYARDASLDNYFVDDSAIKFAGLDLAIKLLNLIEAIKVTFKKVSTFTGVAGDTETLYYLDTAYDTYEKGFYVFTGSAFVNVDQKCVKFVSTFTGVEGDTDVLYYLDTAYGDYKVGFYRFLKAAGSDPDRFVAISKALVQYVSTFTGVTGDAEVLYYLSAAYDSYKAGFYRYNGTAFVNINPKEFFYVSTFTGVVGDDEALYYLDTAYDTYKVGFYRFVPAAGSVPAKFIPLGSEAEVFTDVDELPDTDISKATIYRIPYSYYEYQGQKVEKEDAVFYGPGALCLNMACDNTNGLSLQSSSQSYQYPLADITDALVQQLITDQLIQVKSTETDAPMFKVATNSYCPSEDVTEVDGGYKLYHNPTETDGEYIEIGGGESPFVAGVGLNSAVLNGGNNVAEGDNSVAEGKGTKTNNDGEHAEGKFNYSYKANVGEEDFATQHSVGIGASDADRKNAVEILANGEMFLHGAGGYDGTNMRQGSGADMKINPAVKSVQDILRNIPIKEQQYLRVDTPLANAVLSVRKTGNAPATEMEYSLDCETWTKATIPFQVTFSSTVYLRGENEAYASSEFEYTTIEVLEGANQALFSLSGNIMSLVYGANVFHRSELQKTNVFRNLFARTKVENAGALILPTTVLSDGCYAGMFMGCTSLATAPALPATQLAANCYHGMFMGCTSLVEAPALPATQLAANCYHGMFQGTSLATAPALPATQLADGCYAEMFMGCPSLATAPALPAMQLAANCYYGMFMGCNSLATAPALPAMQLAANCYYSMFIGCKSLATAPALPATQLADGCYYDMFSGCRSLNYVKILAEDISAEQALFNWLGDVSATGIFTKKTGVALPSGANGIPVGWTVIGVDAGKVFTDVDELPSTDIDKDTIYRTHDVSYEYEGVRFPKSELSWYGPGPDCTSMDADDVGVNIRAASGNRSYDWDEVNDTLIQELRDLNLVAVGVDGAGAVFFSHSATYGPKSGLTTIYGDYHLYHNPSQTAGGYIEIGGGSEGDVFTDVNTLPTTGISKNTIYRILVDQYKEDGTILPSVPKGYVSIRPAIVIIDETGITDNGTHYAWEDITDDQMDFWVIRRQISEVYAADLMTNSTCFKTAANHYVYKDHVTKGQVYELYHNPTEAANAFIKIGGEESGSVEVDEVTTEEVNGKVQANAVIVVNTLPTTDIKTKSIYRRMTLVYRHDGVEVNSVSPYKVRANDTIEATPDGLRYKPEGPTVAWTDSNIAQVVSDGIVGGYIEATTWENADFFGYGDDPAAGNFDYKNHFSRLLPGSLWQNPTGTADGWEEVGKEPAIDEVTIVEENSILKAVAVIDVTSLPSAGMKVNSLYRKVETVMVPGLHIYTTYYHGGADPVPEPVECYKPARAGVEFRTNEIYIDSVQHSYEELRVYKADWVAAGYIVACDFLDIDTTTNDGAVGYPNEGSYQFLNRARYTYNTDPVPVVMNKIFQYTPGGEWESISTVQISQAAYNQLDYEQKMDGTTYIVEG